jgi:ATP-dependent DNA helicase
LIARTEALLPTHRIVQRRDKPSSQDVIVPLVQQLVAQGEKLLVFRNMRGAAQACAKYPSKKLGLSPQRRSSTRCRARIWPGRRKICASASPAARRSTTPICCAPNAKSSRRVIATPTAASMFWRRPQPWSPASIPRHLQVLAENEFVGEDGRQFTVAEYKNMAGRAGRLGYNEIGKAIILAEDGVRRTGSGLAIRLRNPLKPRFLRPFLTIRVEV